jgi:hypothetical protein
VSQQGPIIVISTAGRPPFAAALEAAKLFPVIDIAWHDAARAIAGLQPGAVLVDMSDGIGPPLAALAAQIATRRPYLPLIAIDPAAMLPGNAMPFSSNGGRYDRLAARLSAALRVRSLHATVLRRLNDEPIVAGDGDPIDHAMVLLIGRGGAYPALSVSLGQRMGIVGALSIEAAAKHLSLRDIDGIVLGEGFTPRVMDAFLTVLAEDSRFRNLPVVVTSENLVPDYELPNLEIISGSPAYIAANASPLIRQHALEIQLSRQLRSIDAGGLLDPGTGLLTPAAFDRDFATAVFQTQARGGGLSVARFAFDPDHPRARLDGGRIVSRLMRQMDFGVVREDGSVVVVFADADLRTAHMIARRLSSVMRHTSHGEANLRSEPVVTVASMQAQDSARSLLARLYEPTRRAAS